MSPAADPFQRPGDPGGGVNLPFPGMAHDTGALLNHPLVQLLLSHIGVLPPPVGVDAVIRFDSHQFAVLRTDLQNTVGILAAVLGAAGVCNLLIFMPIHQTPYQCFSTHECPPNSIWFGYPLADPAVSRETRFSNRIFIHQNSCFRGIAGGFQFVILHRIHGGTITDKRRQVKPCR